MLITVSGPPGSGKSTVASGLADALGYEHVSGGDIFRELAADRGYTLAEFNALAEEDDAIDRDLDRRQREIAADAEDLVLESRLAGWMAGEYATLRFWLDAPSEVRAERIAEREAISVAAARSASAERENSEKQRYRDYYGIDFEDLSIYDLALNTARWSPPDTVDLIGDAVRLFDPTADEGPIPIQGVAYDF